MSSLIAGETPCCGQTLVKKFAASFGGPKISDFVARSSIDSVAVETFRWDAATKWFVSSSGAPPPQVRTAYNGTERIPTSGGRLLAVNLAFPTATVQVAVYDGNDMAENDFTGRYMSSESAISGFIANVNRGGFRCGTTADPYTVNAFFGILKFYAMLYDFFGRVGVVDGSHVMASIANIRFTNAFWSGLFMAFGNARDSGGRVKPLTSIDVTGHEMAHGLQTFTTEFVYRGESGALNESIADVFGTALEAYVASDVDIPDWTMGEQFEFVIRDMSNPKAKQQPTEHRGTYWADTRSNEDNGGVHTNSGVTNYLCYLAAAGGPGGRVVKEDATVVEPIRPSETFGLFDYARVVYAVINSRELSTTCSLSDFARAVVARVPPSETDRVGRCGFAVGLLPRPSGVPPPDSPRPTPAPPGRSTVQMVRSVVGDRWGVSANVSARTMRLPSASTITVAVDDADRVLRQSPIVVSLWFGAPSDRKADFKHVASAPEPLTLSFGAGVLGRNDLHVQVSSILAPELAASITVA